MSRELYEQYIGGDDEALAELIRTYFDGLALYLTGFAGDIRSGEELAEDVFVRLAVRKPRFRGECSFKTWLYTIGRNTALNELRRRRRTVPTEDPELLLAEQNEYEESYLQEERKLCVRTAMRRLSPEDQRLLWLIYFEGFSHRETAKILGRTEKSVKTAVYRARLALKDELEKEGITSEEYG